MKTTTWYEAIIYPDNFRIDFGDKKDSNAVIYLKGSVYSFRKGKLFRKTFNTDNLTFLLGEMYSFPFDSVKSKIQQQGYDISKFHETNWKGQPVYVIGASDPAEKCNQLWIDRKKLVILKFVRFYGEEQEEGVFTGHKRFGNGWSETGCEFYVNDKLVQKEIYHDCKANTEIDGAIFDPNRFKGRD